MNPDQTAPQGEQSDLGPYLQHRLLRTLAGEEHEVKVKTGRKRITIVIFKSLKS